MSPQNAVSAVDWWRGGFGFLPIAVIPAMYVFGFFAWSVHSLNYGLGFLPLSLVQYLVPGGIALFLAAAGLAIYMLLRLIVPVGPRGWFRRGLYLVLRGVLLGASLSLAFFVLRAVVVSVPMIQIPDDPASHFDGPIVLILLILSTLLFPTLYGYALIILHTLGKRGVSKSMVKTSTRYVQISITVLVASIAALAATSSTIMPHLEQEFGGGLERKASFELDPDELSSGTASRLWPDWNLTDLNGTVRTPPVRVLFEGQDGVLVRSFSEDSRNGVLFEIQQSAIKSIVWHS